MPSPASRWPTTSPVPAARPGLPGRLLVQGAWIMPVVQSQTDGGGRRAPGGPRLSPLPVRQWVLSVPKRLRWYLKREPQAVSAVLHIFLGIILTQSPTGWKHGAVPHAAGADRSSRGPDPASEVAPPSLSRRSGTQLPHARQCHRLWACASQRGRPTTCRPGAKRTFACPPSLGAAAGPAVRVAPTGWKSRSKTRRRSLSSIPGSPSPTSVEP
jgi:hypothetical protein